MIANSKSIVCTATTPFYSEDAHILYHGDCFDIMKEIPSGSVDMIFTDPPYTRDANVSRTYSLLGFEAARLLKPGAFLYAYCGAEFLIEGLNGLSHGLSWFWIFNVRHRQATPRLWYKRLIVSSKPVLVFTNGEPDPRRLNWEATDSAMGSVAKDHHAWGQHPGLARRSINARTEPGELVLDPFSGGGSFLRAAKDCGRRSIGIETELKSCQMIVENMAQEVLSIPMLRTEQTSFEEAETDASE